MATPEVNNSLKEALLETLRSILSANQDVRKAGESQVQALEVTEGQCQRKENYVYVYLCKKNIFYRIWYQFN